LPALTDSGELMVFAYCSPACADWVEAATAVALSPESPTSQRSAEKLDALARLLDTRDYALQFDMPNGGV
jgi:hypothetical protein